MPTGIIAIDVGTQGTKGALFAQDMRVVCTAFEPSKLITPGPGVVWQEADAMYSSCINVMRELMQHSGYAAGDIAAVGLDSQMAGIMGIAEDGEASTYYDSWMDMRCSKYIGEMRQKAGDRLTAITGGPFSNTHGAKILWWKKEQPEAYAKTAKFVLPHGYIIGKLTGKRADEATFDHTCLHFSGFGDNEKKVWSRELLDIFEVDPGKMARIVSPFEVVGVITREVAALTGLAQGVPVVAGCGDTAASTFGSGMFDPDLIQDCAGTASVLCSVVDRFVPDITHQTMTMMRSPIDGYWLPLAYINGGGLCLRWFRDLLGREDAPFSYAELEKQAQALRPGSEGLLFVPHFSGRVLPLEPAMRGSLVGLSFNHGKGHIYRAIMESIAYEYAYYLSILRDLFPESSFKSMISIGGGSNSPLFSSIKADVLGLDVHTFKLGDTALLGSAVVAAMGVGVLTDYKKTIRDAMEEVAVYRPNAAAHEQYQGYAQAYLNALAMLGAAYAQQLV